MKTHRPENPPAARAGSVFDERVAVFQTATASRAGYATQAGLGSLSYRNTELPQHPLDMLTEK